MQSIARPSPTVNAVGLFCNVIAISWLLSWCILEMVKSWIAAGKLDHIEEVDLEPKAEPGEESEKPKQPPPWDDR